MAGIVGLQEEEWVNLVRVLVLLTLMPAVWFGIIPIGDATGGVILLLGGYVILLTVGPRWVAVLRKPEHIIVLDILVSTLVVLISGNLSSPFLYLYYLAILEAAARLNLRQALAASVAVSAMIILLWVHLGHLEPLEVAGFRVGAFNAGGFFLALFLGTLMQEYRSSADLAQAYDSALEGWSRALDLRDHQTEGHAERVTEMTLRLARAMGLRESELVNVRRGALLHDIGKMAIPDSILFKPGRLTEEEWEIMRRHPAYAYELLSPIAYLRRALDIPYSHHEKWDGTGYPRGLKGEEIPLVARIFAVADVWDALRSDRPYSTAWPEEQAREYIRQQAGTHFDPRVVQVFLEMSRETPGASKSVAADGDRDRARQSDQRGDRQPSRSLSGSSALRGIIH